jgi:hypothetical protein
MRKFLKCALVAAAMVCVNTILGGCVGAVELANGRHIPLNSKEFEDYVEYVFKYQNRVADELAFALVDADVTDAKAQMDLEQAEANLQTACSGINELATARRDGQRISVRRKLEFARQVPDCEQAATVANGVIETR